MSTTQQVNERLAKLTSAGVSVWLDQIRRSLIESGELARMAAEESLRAATLGGARALRLQRQCGSVRLGKRCDLLLLDAESYLELPYRLGVNLVDKTICQGQVV